MNCSFEPAVFLAGLRRQCISIWPDWDADILHIWPANRLTTEQVTFIREHKAEITAYLRCRNADLLPPDEICRAWRRRYANTSNGSWTP
jgi:hypothetical protein